LYLSPYKDYFFLRLPTLNFQKTGLMCIFIFTKPSHGYRSHIPRFRVRVHSCCCHLVHKVPTKVGVSNMKNSSKLVVNAGTGWMKGQFCPQKRHSLKVLFPCVTEISMEMFKELNALEGVT